MPEKGAASGSSAMSNGAPELPVGCAACHNLQSMHVCVRHNMAHHFIKSPQFSRKIRSCYLEKYFIFLTIINFYLFFKVDYVHKCQRKQIGKKLLKEEKICFCYES